MRTFIKFENEPFEDHTSNMKVSEVEGVIKATGDIVLSEMVSNLKKSIIPMAVKKELIKKKYDMLLKNNLCNLDILVSLNYELKKVDEEETTRSFIKKHVKIYEEIAPSIKESPIPPENKIGKIVESALKELSAYITPSEYGK